MRNVEVFTYGFNNIKTLCQYLYMSPTNVVHARNSLGFNVEYRMTDDLHFMGRLLNTSYEVDYTDKMTIPEMLNIINQLKSAKPEAYINAYENRWEEIEEIVQNNSLPVLV